MLLSVDFYLSEVSKEKLTTFKSSRQKKNESFTTIWL